MPAILNLTLILAVVAGAATALQSPTNALLSRAFGSPIVAAFLSFLVGTIILAVLAFLTPSKADPAAIRTLPWQAWAGGLYGAFFVAVAAFAAPRIGVAMLATAMVAGQLTAAVLIDHTGALGLARHPLSLERVGGLALVIAGVVLVRRG